ncbi:unnamed protein product [Adineta steineri]|uniref:G-protein coupled receptors family 1 profile domain-containing protein n=1 Tax=Adineta steineri TaxID=433720 RepID=A0A815LHF5_9BILA|nr:unnamed protein product [Adineta steineri]
MATDDNTNETSFEDSEISLPRPIRLWVLVIFDSSSIICTLLLLYYLSHNRASRKALHNHVIIILLILGLGTQLIDVPSYIAFIIHSGVVKPSIPSSCLVWWFAAFGMYNGGTILMAWAAFERHILVFNYRWISTRRGRILGHYLPISILLLYIITFYIYVLFIFSCENTYDYTLPICNAYPCYQADPFIGMWEFIVNNIVPSVLVAILSFALLIRVIQQKRRLHQRIQWRKQRKMTIQLVSLSILNIIFNIPLNIVSLAHLCGLPASYGVEAEQYFYFSCYFLIFLFPFVCLFSYTELYKKIKLKFLYHIKRSNNVVAPIVNISDEKN